MKTIQVTEHDGIYSCDISISKEEWLEILKDSHFPDDYRATLLKFYYSPSHRGSCTAVGNSYGGNAQKLSSNIREIGRFAQNYLNQFQVVRSDGSACFWIIPMCEGMDLPKGSEGSFEWKLRPELAEAICEYLYCYLVERYKVVRKDIPINDTKWTEIYKWELITASKGKTPLEIVRDSVAHPSKAALGGFENLIDAVRDNKTLKYLVENNSDGLQDALSRLTDESQTINQRLAAYKAAMAALLPASGFNSKANDERTASVILTCVNPQKYTIYKYDVYNMLCKYLGVTKKPTGQCYEHFMELLKPLSDFTSQDKELQQIVSSSLTGQNKSDLLLAQDILWILLISFPQQLGYVRSIMLPNKQRVWLWSRNIGTETEGSLGMGSLAKAIKDFRPYKSKNALRKAYQQDVGNKDLKIPDAYWSFLNEVSVGDIVVLFEPKKGNGKQYHLLHGWGMFTSDCTIDESNENPMRREVEWHYPFLTIPKQNEEMGNSIFFQGTTDKQALHIKELLDINTDEIMESKYQKYIDLLKANYNLILTGAPGTGKSYMAIEMANEIIKQHDGIKPLDILHQAILKYEPNPIKEEQYSGLLKGFNERFPKDSLKDMTLEDYCIGRGDENKDNFCFWLERQLKPLGYYFPGSSRSYLLYWNKAEESYKVHGYLKHQEQEEPSMLMTVLAGDLHNMVNNDNPSVMNGKLGESLILKILNSYYPEEYAPINSKSHIDNIISLFNIPCNSQNVFERNKAIFKFYKEQTAGKNISSFGFMEILYSNFNIKDGEMLDNGEIVLKGECRFVQFHPSYDYTDFVEGLRPLQEEGKSEIGFERRDGEFKSLCSLAVKNPNKKYVMIIDEINRGEISKIFGELFFSIDPGYRGHKVKVRTQYQNLLKDDDVFKDGFYVPENVYIIGTMNDIDRSVESMDFAMRRRFAWKEVTAEDSMQMLNDLPNAEVVKARMKNLNDAIQKTHGLGKAYQTGAAYLKKIELYDGDFEKLWEYHLEGLLYEYLRGNTDADKQLTELKKAYDNEIVKHEVAD